MIKSFKHKGLEKFYKSGSAKGIQANHAKTHSQIQRIPKEKSGI
jgi:plasmid maintenance system killer protein